MPIFKLSSQPENKEKFRSDLQKNQEEAEAINIAPAEISAEALEAKEAAETTGDQKEEDISELTAPASLTLPAPVVRKKNEHLVEIEKILSENLKDLYLELPLEKQREFKAEGEKTANLIWQMVESAKIQVKKIVQLISRWLKKMPGINRYFIEQESKIKTDKIIHLAKQHGTRNHSS